MSKKGQNDLKFGHKMHYGDFNHFPKFCQNLFKNDKNQAENCHKMSKNG